MMKALELRSRALMLVAGRGLDLTDRVDLAGLIARDLKPELVRSKDVLLVGRSLAGLAKQVVGMSDRHVASIDILDAETPPMLLQDQQGAEVRVILTALDDYAADPGVIDAGLRDRPIASVAELRERLQAIEAARREHPMIMDGSKDLVVHDLLANRLDRTSFARSLDETFRVLAVEGCLCTVALLADEEAVADCLQVAGAAMELRALPLETEILDALRDAGFHGMSLTLLYDAPVLVRAAVEARAVLVRAYKGTQGPCYDEGHAVIYKGPWSSVTDDDGHVYRRGIRTAVCRKTYDILTRAPYVGAFAGLVRYGRSASEQPILFDCDTPSIRHPGVTKGTIPLRPPSGGTAYCGGAEGQSDGCC